MTTGTLEAALGFTADDLSNNRAGRLSPSQRAKMTVKRGQSQVINLVMGGIFIVILIVIAIVVLPGALAPQAATSSAVPAPIIIAVVVVVAVVIALTTLRSRRKLTQLNGAVFPVEGVAKTRAGAFGDANQLSTTGMIYRVKIGSSTFVLTNQSQVDAFEDGKTYRGYYVKSTVPVLVSAEEI